MTSLRCSNNTLDCIWEVPDHVCSLGPQSKWTDVFMWFYKLYQADIWSVPSEGPSKPLHTQRSQFSSLANSSCRSQFPRGLRRESAAARLLWLWVRIPLGHGYLSLVSVLYCQVEFSASRWSLIHRSYTEGDGSLCVIWKFSIRKRARPLLVCSATKRTYSNLHNIYGIITAFINTRGLR